MRVAMQSRRCGIARQLYDHAEQFAVKRGFTRIELSFKVAEFVSLETYSRLGFKIHSVRRSDENVGWLPGLKEESVFMYKNLEA